MRPAIEAVPNPHSVRVHLVLPRSFNDAQQIADKFKQGIPVILNLQSADTVINIEPPWNPAVLEQRIARVHRLGQHRPVQVINLVTRDSIEERVLRTIALKKSLFDGVFSGTTDEVSFASLGQRAFLDTVRDLLASTASLTSSLADTVMIHLAEQVAPGIDVVFLDTGYHFVETIGTRDAVSLVHNVNVINVEPEHTVAEQDALWGKDLFARNPDQCCAMRKVAPLGKALTPYTAWASGVRRADSAVRASTPVVAWDPKRRLVKVSPIAAWTDEDVAAYIEENSLMVNPLLEDGYPSIGCEPCTVRATGDDVRAGRWAGLGKSECGIHL
jgi:phosphoadenosine phosphosulfate reductase